MIHDLNLTRLGASTTNASKTSQQDDCCSHLLISVQDFASVISTHKGVGVKMFDRFPDVAEHVWKGMPLYRQTLALVDNAKQHVFTMYLDSIWAQVVAGSSKPPGNASMMDLQAVERFILNHRKNVQLFHAYAGFVQPLSSLPAESPVPLLVEKLLSLKNADGLERTGEMDESESGKGGSAKRRLLQTASRHSGESESGQGGSAKRRLLQASPNRSPVDVYSSLVASSQGFSNLAVASSQQSSSSSSSGNGMPLITETWLEGPYGWPPRVSVNANLDSCAAGDAILQSAQEVFSVLNAYYASDFASNVRKPPWDFSSNVPTIISRASELPEPGSASMYGSTPARADEDDRGLWSALLFNSALGAVHTYIPSLEEAVSGFLNLRGTNGVSRDTLTLDNIGRDLFKCSFDNIMFCGRQGSDGLRVRRNIVMCGLLAVIGWVVVAWVASSIPLIGWPLSTIVMASMVVLVPSTAIHLAYGTGLTCFPMVPTCIVQDLVYTLQTLMPMHAKWPDALMKYPGCFEHELNNQKGGNSDTTSR